MEEESIHIVMEFAEKGDLYKVNGCLNINKVIERSVIKEEILF